MISAKSGGIESWDNQSVEILEDLIRNLDLEKDN
jgi:hypothetical protein